MENIIVKYSKNYLTKTILRVDFTTPLETLNSDNLNKIKSALSEFNVETKEQQINAVQVNIPDKSSKIEVVGIQAVYDFAEPKGRFILQNDWFAVELDKYSTFESLRSIFNKGLSPCLENFEIKSFKRIGLRYINSIELAEIKKFPDWVKFIKSPYVSLYDGLQTKIEGYSIRKSMNNLVVSNGEYLININFGIWNNDFPKQITSPVFIIDIDCSISDMIIGVSDFQARLPQMNIICLNLFKEFITNDFENRLK